MKRIAILSPSGTGNLGDEATVSVLIEEIRRRYPATEIYGLTSNPADTRNRHKVPAYPARNVSSAQQRGDRRNHNAGPREGRRLQNRIKGTIKTIPLIYPFLQMVRALWTALSNSIAEAGFIGKSFRLINGTDLLIVAGSGQLCDNFYGPWGFPYTLLKWSVLTKLRGAKLVFLSCGAGPIDAWLSKAFITLALRLADYRSFRDEESKSLVQTLGIASGDPVVPDLVFASRLNSRNVCQSRLIAVNPFPYYDYRYWPVSSPDVYTRYLERLASFVSWLIKNQYTVLLFPTQLRADPLVIEDVKTILMTDRSLDLDKYLRTPMIATFDDLIAQISRAGIVVASRFHGVLLSLLLEKPVLALSHHPKVASLMQHVGQTDYILDIGTFDAETAAVRFAALETKRDIVHGEIKSNVIMHQQRLESQYDELFGVREPDGDIESIPTDTPVLS